MKLLYLHSGAIDSGMANSVQVLHMCRAFAALGVDVTLAVPGYDSSIVRNNISVQIGEDPKFKLRTFNRFTVFGRLSMVGGYFAVRKLIETIETDCCFVRSAVYLNAPIKQRLPTVFEAHNARIHQNPFLNAVWTRNVIRNSKNPNLVKFISISQALTDYWINAGVPKEKGLVLHDAVDSQQYSTVAERNLVRRDLGLSVNKKIVVYTGSLYKDREIDNILHLAELFTEALFIVVGGPTDMKQHFSKMCDERKITNLNFVGYVPHQQIKKYLFAADVLLMIWSRKVPTINYSSPLKMFEYMAAERIIVGHAFPTILEVLKDGEHAYLANPDSFDDLRSKMTLALSEKYPSVMAKKARALAMKEFTWDARARAILPFLEATIHQRYL